MQTGEVITKYVPYFNALKAYHKNSPVNREKICHQYFQTILIGIYDVSLRERINRAYQREAARSRTG